MQKYLLLLFVLVGCTAYDYEVCDNNVCKRFPVNVVQPSAETEIICTPDFEEAKIYGAKEECITLPLNHLMGKSGTDKPYCNNAPYLGSDYLDNWWNAGGLIDDCEMPPKAEMSFIFKQHDQSIRIYTGTIQIKIDVINYENDYKALQVFTGEDMDNNNLPDSWVYCGNVDKIGSYSTKIIKCKGNNLKFIKLVNAEWNTGSLFIDNVEVLKA